MKLHGLFSQFRQNIAHTIVNAGSVVIIKPQFDFNVSWVVSKVYQAANTAM
jgi:hypothetical protein